jgi:hypothetical protein
MKLKMRKEHQSMREFAEGSSDKSKPGGREE